MFNFFVHHFLALELLEEQAFVHGSLSRARRDPVSIGVPPTYERLLSNEVGRVKKNASLALPENAAIPKLVGCGLARHGVGSQHAGRPAVAISSVINQ